MRTCWSFLVLFCFPSLCARSQARHTQRHTDTHRDTQTQRERQAPAPVGHTELLPECLDDCPILTDTFLR